MIADEAVANRPKGRMLEEKTDPTMGSGGRSLNGSLWKTVGPSLILMGVLLAMIGLLLRFLAGRRPLRPLPGDLHWRRGRIHLFFPLGTSLLVSILLTVLLNLILLLGFGRTFFGR